MKGIPFAMIQNAKSFDPEAVTYILRHFDGYIMSCCLATYIDENGNSHSIVDDDLYYKAQLAVFSAIANFEFQEPPEDFRI